MKTKLVVAFMYFRDTKRVVLIRKNRPEWMAGCLNGVGGHIEEGETAVEAAVREFQEETGVETSVDDWSLFCRLNSNHGTDVSFYAAISESERKCPVSTTTDEIVNIVPVDRLVQMWGDKIVPNMAYLVPMGWYHTTHGGIDVSVVERDMR